MVPNILGHCRAGGRYREGQRGWIKKRIRKRLREKERERGEWKNRMITKAAQISQLHISSIMWISRGDYARRWQAEGGLITIHHKGCFLISHTLISFCLQIASHSSLSLTHTHNYTWGTSMCNTHIYACMHAHADISLQTYMLLMLLKFQINAIFLMTSCQMKIVH